MAKNETTPIEETLVQLSYVASTASTKAASPGYMFGTWIDLIKLEKKRLDALSKSLDSAIERAKKAEAVTVK